MKVLYCARIGRLDFLWTVNRLARNVTKWTVACDKQLHRLISYMHHTAQNVQACWIGDKADDIHLAFFVDASFAADVTDSKSTTGGILCLI